jgi:hypothetical protein
MATHYGPVGAAVVWIVLNGLYMLIGVPLTHRRLLPFEMRRWFSEDVIPPVFAVFLVVGVGRWLIKSPMPTLTSILSLFIVLICALGIAALFAQHMRTWVFAQLAKVKSILT